MRVSALEYGHRRELPKFDVLERTDVLQLIPAQLHLQGATSFVDGLRLNG